jgi:hypothetical protein
MLSGIRRIEEENVAVGVLYRGGLRDGRSVRAGLKFELGFARSVSAGRSKLRFVGVDSRYFNAPLICLIEYSIDWNILSFNMLV